MRAELMRPVRLWRSALFALGVGVVSAAITDARQETPAAGERRGNRCYDGRMWKDCGMPSPPVAYPSTRQWIVADLNPPASEWGWTPARINVVETAGVCLYVVRGFTKDTVAITAVPKTQLPKDTGCQ